MRLVAILLAALMASTATAQVVPTNGLIRWYKFESNLVCSVSGATLAAPRGAPPYTNSYSGYCTSAGGNSLYVQDTNTVLLSGSSAWTVSFSIRYMGLLQFFADEYKSLLTLRGGAAANSLYWYTPTRTAAGWYPAFYEVSLTGLPATIKPTAPALYAWKKFTLVWDGAGGSVKVYDGKSLCGSSSTALSTFTQDVALVFGADPYAAARGMCSDYDDCQVWNRALSESEIAMLQPAGLNNAISGTPWVRNMDSGILHWGFEGQNAYNSFDPGTPGMAGSSCQFTPANRAGGGDFLASTVLNVQGAQQQWVADTAMRLYGDRDYSAYCRVCPTNTRAYEAAFVTYNPSAAPANAAIGFLRKEFIGSGYWSVGANELTISSGAASMTNRWQFLGEQRSTTRGGFIYTNSVEYARVAPNANATTSSPLAYLSAGYVDDGAGNVGRVLTGQIDDCFLFRRSLTPTEVRFVYAGQAGRIVRQINSGREFSARSVQ